MGWNSGQDVMDAAIVAARSLIAATLAEANVDDGDFEDYDEMVTELLRPFVAQIAAKLREEDWDTIDESEFFDTFAQEMLGHDDQDHAYWLREQVSDAVQFGTDSRVVKWTDMLVQYMKRKERE